MIRILLPAGEIKILIILENATEGEIHSINSFLLESILSLREFLQIVFKRTIKSVEYHNDIQVVPFARLREIAIMIGTRDVHINLRILMPNEFFRLFSKSVGNEDSSDSLEEMVESYLRNPGRLIPDLRSFLQSLPQVELLKLFDHLQRLNRLTPYQLFLIIRAYPELSGKIKHALSKHSIKDVLLLNRSAHQMKIGRRDIMGGIYSVQESIYFMIREDHNLDYSRLLSQMQRLLALSLNPVMLSKKPFNEWIADMISDNLINRVISATEDRVLGMAFSRDMDRSFESIKSILSKNKRNDIEELIDRSYSYGDILSSRITLLSRYRSFKNKTRNTGPESLDYLLSRFSTSTDYFNLLLMAGWFHLSTALKSSPVATVGKVLSHLPQPARILVEDVLKGIINPNILHDEIQVKKARKICIEVINKLYIDGIIDLYP